MNQPFQNTDVEIWRGKPDDAFFPSVHVTSLGAIGIQAGGRVVVRSAREWVRIGWDEAPETDSEYIHRWRLSVALPFFSIKIGLGRQRHADGVSE